MLKKMNCSVDIANNGREAVEKAELKHYDLIFMDIEMPEMSKYNVALTITNEEYSKKFQSEKRSVLNHKIDRLLLFCRWSRGRYCT